MDTPKRFAVGAYANHHTIESQRQKTAACFHRLRFLWFEADAEELAAAPDAEPTLPIDFTADCQLDQLVEHVAVNQRFEVGAHMHVRRRFLSDRVDLDADQMFRAGLGGFI